LAASDWRADPAQEARTLGAIPVFGGATADRGPAPGRGRAKYAPYAAQKRAELRGRRPKASKFEHAELASVVPAEMQVCPETIYQALYVQGHGHLRADLHQHLRTGRAVRRSRRSTAKSSGKIPDMILISERPAEVADRAVPGHWEGDLILGSNCHSAIATLVERQTRYTMLVHLPEGHGAVAVRDGLLRRHFPKGTDLSVHSPERLLDVATELNARPQTLGGITPAGALERLLLDPVKPIVATTA